MTTLTGNAKLAGVIGHPVTHSLSPRLHGYWLYEHAIDGAYVPLSVHPDDLREVLPALMKMGFAGVNLTLPHKELALAMVDTLDSDAKAAGAVNTIIFKDGVIHGRNTDVYGCMQNLKQGAVTLASYKEHALVIGAGGAARAVCVGLKQEGFKKISVTNRTPDRLEKLKSHLPYISTIPWEARHGLASVSLLINTTSLGMKGQDALDLSLEKLPQQSLVYDIVYNPLETPLLAEARRRGNQTVDGLGMLLWQAKPGFEQWFGVEPTVSAQLRAHVMKGLA